MSCVYTEDPYVGRGLRARYFVLDEATNAILAGNDGKGYDSYQQAYIAYMWTIKGPAARKAFRLEQEMMYDWSQKNKIVIDRLDGISAAYQSEGRILTPKHIMLLFKTHGMECPTTHEAFLAAYQNNFYKDVIIKRRQKEKKREEWKKQWDLKAKTDEFIDAHDNLALLREQMAPENIEKAVGPIKNFINEKMKMYNERPMDSSSVAKMRATLNPTTGEVVATGRPFRTQEWEVVEKDPRIHPIYDTFSQEPPESVDRIMDREILRSPESIRGRLATQMMVDPISLQIVQKRNTRCISPTEWREMAGPPKKKKKRPAPPPPVQTEEWSQLSEEESQVPQKPAPRSKTKRKVEPEHANASISFGTKGAKADEQTKEVLTAQKKKALSKNKPPKKVKLPEEEVPEEDEFDDEEDIPSVKEVLSQLKSSISQFFSDIKNEAEKQKAEEVAQKEAKKQAKAAHKEEKQTKEPSAQKESSFVESIIPDVKPEKVESKTDSFGINESWLNEEMSEDELVAMNVNSLFDFDEEPESNQEV